MLTRPRRRVGRLHRPPSPFDSPSPIGWAFVFVAPCQWYVSVMARSCAVSADVLEAVMGWMIGAIVVLVSTNVLAVWLLLKLRKQAECAETARWRRYEDDYRKESRLRCAVWELRGSEWCENMAWCGGGYPDMSPIDHAIMFMEELTGQKHSGYRPWDEREEDPSNDPGYLEYLKDMEEAEDELEAACPSGQNN